METENRKVNILFVIVQMKMGGSEHLVWDLVRNLDRELFRPHIAWFYEEKPLNQFADLGVPLFFVPKIRRFDFETMRRLAGIIRDHNIDVVNAHHYLSVVYSFYGCKLANRAGLIYTEHSAWEIEVISQKWRLAGKLLLQFVDGVVGISDKVTAHLQKTFWLTGKKAATIANGVDCTLFAEPRDKNIFKLKYGLELDGIAIGMVANLKKNKNHLFLLKAFRNVRKLHGNLKLLLIGQGFLGDPESSEEDIRNFIVTEHVEDSVTLLGGREDVPDLLKAVDIFCLTSCEEGMPISLIEAMASGLPVVGTDVNGIREIIIPEENGILVEPNNEGQLTRELTRLVDDTALRLTMGAKSRELAYQNYALETCIKKYQSIFLGAAPSGKI